MRCFNHPELDAVGICKVCQKGLCEACSVDLEHSLACKGKHESLAEATHALVLRSMRVQGTAGRSRYVVPAFYAFMGLMFSFFGLRGDSKADNLLLLMGLGFLVFAVVVFVANRRAFGPSNRAGESA